VEDKQLDDAIDEAFGFVSRIWGVVDLATLADNSSAHIFRKTN
jgi:hypothetical protein